MTFRIIDKPTRNPSLDAFFPADDRRNLCITVPESQFDCCDQSVVKLVASVERNLALFPADATVIAPPCLWQRWRCLPSHRLRQRFPQLLIAVNIGSFVFGEAIGSSMAIKP